MGAADSLAQALTVIDIGLAVATADGITSGRADLGEGFANPLEVGASAHAGGQVANLAVLAGIPGDAPTGGSSGLAALSVVSHHHMSGVGPAEIAVGLSVETADWLIDFGAEDLHARSSRATESPGLAVAVRDATLGFLGGAAALGLGW
jgi:hypothetical protein